MRARGKRTSHRSSVDAGWLGEDCIRCFGPLSDRCRPLAPDAAAGMILRRARAPAGSQLLTSPRSSGSRGPLATRPRRRRTGFGLIIGRASRPCWAAGLPPLGWSTCAGGPELGVEVWAVHWPRAVRPVYISRLPTASATAATLVAVSRLFLLRAYRLRARQHGAGTDAVGSFTPFHSDSRPPPLAAVQRRTAQTRGVPPPSASSTCRRTCGRRSSRPRLPPPSHACAGIPCRASLGRASGGGCPKGMLRPTT